MVKRSEWVHALSADDAACATILTELGAMLDGEPSPYILSDLRWGKGPLYVRYGAFVNRYTVDEKGDVVPAIAGPDGALVQDRRGPVFQTPPWVTLPDFLTPHLAARNAVTVADLPYTIERVLHFSNGGGIYLARDTRTDTQVVLKEGRPHAGLDAWGHDALRRVEREHDILRRLAGIPGIPAVHDLFWVGEHRFLAMEYVEGDVLGKAITLRYPLIDPATCTCSTSSCARTTPSPCWTSRWRRRWRRAYARGWATRASQPAALPDWTSTTTRWPACGWPSSCR